MFLCRFWISGWRCDRTPVEYDDSCNEEEEAFNVEEAFFGKTVGVELQINSRKPWVNIVIW